jgi:hypothetical protein
MIPDDYMDTLKLERIRKDKHTKKRSLITKRAMILDYFDNQMFRKEFIKWSEKEYPDLIITLYDLLRDYRSDDKQIPNTHYQQYPDGKKHHHKRKLYHLPSIS